HLRHLQRQRADGQRLRRRVLPTTLTFGPGETSKQVTASGNGDTVFESDETFSLHLSSPAGAALSDDTGTATIVNDDPVTYLSVKDHSANEGNSGTTIANFTVTRSGNTTVPVSL